jgi:predicted dienelactone hydrolase
MKTKLLLFIAIIFTANAFGQDPSKVGMETRNFVDEERKNWTGTAPRPVFTTVWYPTSSPAKEEKVFIGSAEKPIFISGEAAKNTEISPAKRRYPLIVLSHGTGGSALQLMWLGQALAARGYIVAAVNHHGNTGAEDKYQAQGFILWWERARDLTVAIDKILADSKFGSRIDSKKIGAAGFSLGGASVAAVAGGVFDIEAFDKFCASPERDATCEPQPEFEGAMKEFEQLKTKDRIVIESLKRAEISYRDSRIKAVFAIAPALGASFTPKSLSSIKIPFELVVGESDATAPAKTNAERLVRFIKNSEIKILPGVAHYTFLSECSEFGKTILPICRDAEGVSRAEIHKQVSQKAFEFFRKKL